MTSFRLSACSRLLLKVFPTRVKLQPPPAGPAALRHLARMQRDVAEAAEEDNYRVATAVAASTGVAVPPKASGIYSGSKALNRADWGKVLSWAVAIQTLQTKQGQLEEEWRQEEKVERQQLAAVHQAAAEGAAGEEGSDGSPQLGTPSPTGLRRRRRDSDGTAATSAADASQPLLAQQQRQYQAALMALVASAWQALNLLHLAAVAAHLPWQALRAACDGARWALLEAAGRLPLVGGYLEELLGAGQLTSEQLESELRDLEQELEALERRSAADSNGGGSAVGGASGAASTGSMGGGAGGSGTLRLSETSVRYGLGMLARSSGSQKQSIEPSNSYERQLLGEVCIARGKRYACCGGVPAAAWLPARFACLCCMQAHLLPTARRPHHPPTHTPPATHPLHRCCLPRTAGAASARWAPCRRPRQRCGRRCSCR